METIYKIKEALASAKKDAYQLVLDKAMQGISFSEYDKQLANKIVSHIDKAIYFATKLFGDK